MKYDLNMKTTLLEMQNIAVRCDFQTCEENKEK